MKLLSLNFLFFWTKSAEQAIFGYLILFSVTISSLFLINPAYITLLYGIGTCHRELTSPVSVGPFSALYIILFIYLFFAVGSLALYKV